MLDIRVLLGFFAVFVLIIAVASGVSTYRINARVDSIHINEIAELVERIEGLEERADVLEDRVFHLSLERN